MVVGDKKQVIVLGAVALTILSVGVFELIPKAKTSPIAEAIRATDAAAAAHQKEINEQLPSAITSSPFAKPKIEAHTSTTPPKAAANEGASRSPQPDHSAGGSASEAPLDPHGSFTGTLPGATNPGENTGNSQIHIESLTRTATVEAVLKVERWIAIVTVSDQKEPMRCEIGQKIGGDTILGIDDSGVTFLNGRHVQVVSVGSTVSL